MALVQGAKVENEEANPEPIQTLVELSWDWSNWTFGVHLGAPVIILLILAALVLTAMWIWPRYRPEGILEIDQAEIGVGESKIILRPNVTDRQVAYAIWVELSTRKIGLPIDLDDDVISEVYDSWYNYFSVTRDLIKTVAVTKVRGPSTRKIITLSISVLNEGLRPHLTKWQARFRHWWKKEIDRADEHGVEVIDPQSIQKRFPQYDALADELLVVNKRLIAYRKAMQEIVFYDRDGPATGR